MKNPATQVSQVDASKQCSQLSKLLEQGSQEVFDEAKKKPYSHKEQVDPSTEHFRHCGIGEEQDKQLPSA